MPKTHLQIQLLFEVEIHILGLNGRQWMTVKPFPYLFWKLGRHYITLKSQSKTVIQPIPPTDAYFPLQGVTESESPVILWNTLYTMKQLCINYRYSLARGFTYVWIVYWFVNRQILCRVVLRCGVWAISGSVMYVTITMRKQFRVKTRLGLGWV